jgi:hypothetical protein
MKREEVYLVIESIKLMLYKIKYDQSEVITAIKA